MPLIATNEGLMENKNWLAAICFGDMDKIQLWKANLSQIHIKDLEKCFSANGEGFEKDQFDSIWKYTALERYKSWQLCFSLNSERSWHKAIIGWALNNFVHIMPPLPCLGDDNDGEDDAGDAHAKDADEDGAESKVGEEVVEHLGGDETKEPEYAVVNASHHFLISWDEELTKKSVAHWSKAKLKGSEKENKNSNNEDAASEHSTEEEAAK